MNLLDGERIEAAEELPRIPCVKTASDFWAFSKAERKLADLHLNYETMNKYPLQIQDGGLLLPVIFYSLIQHIMAGIVNEGMNRKAVRLSQSG